MVMYTQSWAGRVSFTGRQLPDGQWLVWEVLGQRGQQLNSGQCADTYSKTAVSIVENFKSATVYSEEVQVKYLLSLRGGIELKREEVTCIKVNIQNVVS